LPTGARPGALSRHYTRLPVVRGPPTSAGPSAFVLSFSGLPNLRTQQISRGETLRFRRDRVATTPSARQVQGIAAAGQLAQPRNALRRFTLVRDHSASIASFRPALTEARPAKPTASRPPGQFRAAPLPLRCWIPPVRAPGQDSHLRSQRPCPAHPAARLAARRRRHTDQNKLAGKEQTSSHWLKA
jgi:hypothetical protein